MIIEPNASIIAGCLPCYGPLFTGGRAPESVVRSARSVLSLRSIHSSANRSHPKPVDSDLNPDNGPANETESQQMEL